MLILPENHELVIDTVEALLPEAQARFDKLSAALSKDDINKIKDKNLSNEIHKIMTTPHKPRRISKSLFIDYCNGKYRKEKKHGE